MRHHCSLAASYWGFITTPHVAMEHASAEFIRCQKGPTATKQQHSVSVAQYHTLMFSKIYALTERRANGNVAWHKG